MPEGNDKSREVEPIWKILSEADPDRDTGRVIGLYARLFDSAENEKIRAKLEEESKETLEKASDLVTTCARIIADEFSSVQERCAAAEHLILAVSVGCRYLRPHDEIIKEYSQQRAINAISERKKKNIAQLREMITEDDREWTLDAAHVEYKNRYDSDISRSAFNEWLKIARNGES
jgi:uncharacterized protein YecA (UPF0149 family)